MLFIYRVRSHSQRLMMVLIVKRPRYVHYFTNRRLPAKYSVVLHTRSGFSGCGVGWQVGNKLCENTFKNFFVINLQAPRFLYIGQAFRYSPENAFYIFNQQIYFIT